MEVSGTTNAINGVQVVESNDVGFGSLTADSFMKLLIAQLENQDPTEPVGNDELLSQLSMMRNLQSDIELSDALKALTTDQQLTTAASYIGKTVTGITESNLEVTGLVDRAFLEGGKAYVEIGSDKLSVDNITSVALPPANAA